MNQCRWLLLLKCTVIIIFVYSNIISRFYKDSFVFKICLHGLKVRSTLGKNPPDDCTTDSNLSC